MDALLPWLWLIPITVIAVLVGLPCYWVWCYFIYVRKRRAWYLANGNRKLPTNGGRS